MNKDITAQQRLESAFDNYFALSKILLADLNHLLDVEHKSQSWRRNFIRAGAALVEGYAHCLRDACVNSFECNSVKLSRD